MGGTYRLDTDTLVNLIALDPDVHNGGPASVHGRPAWSRERGYLLPKDTELAVEWPLLLLGQQWVFLTHDGRRIPA